MCRFIVYKGHEILMADLVTRPRQSLIRQSYKAREREEPLNGDGFGVGWYVPEIDPTPCVFTSILPAWSNRNLHHLAAKTKTCSLFAHVRAASPGSLVSEVNCHPFQHREFLWMHNGSIAQFRSIKRRLRQALDDELYGMTEGTTDSEQAFALYLQNLKPHLSDYNEETLERVMVETIGQITGWTAEVGVAAASYLNFVLSDGQSIVATRYVDSPDVEPQTLYLSEGQHLEHLGGDGDYRLTPVTGSRPGAVIVASEPLTDDRHGWQLVPRNHVVVITPELHVSIRAIG